jgi:hypothetical protein
MNTINSRCECGNDVLCAIHGVPSGRVVLVCPVCYRKTNIYTSLSEADRAWKRGEILKREDYENE